MRAQPTQDEVCQKHRPDLINFFFDFFDEEILVVHPRKIEYSRDPAFDGIFSLPDNALYIPEAMIRSFYFV